MALVQSPILLHRDPQLATGGQGKIAGADGPGQHRGVGAIELDTRSLDQFAALHRLGLTLGGQVHIHPAGEAVLQIP